MLHPQDSGHHLVTDSPLFVGEESRMLNRSACSKSCSVLDYATVEAHSAGAPVYAFGYTYVYGVSPDLDSAVALQRDNSNPWQKIHPKKSWEITNNKLGSTPAREPKSAGNDDQPLLSVHLIDGDPDTIWCSRGQTQPDVEPVWIRLDLPIETRIHSVVLVPHREGKGSESMRAPDWAPKRRAAGQAFPGELAIMVSQDGWHWETVYENPHFVPSSPAEPQEFQFEARPAKQIRIVGRRVPPVLNFGHCMSLAAVEAYDEYNQDVALVSRGTGITVSSTHMGYGMDRFTQSMLWPLQYDLGYKWCRVGYDMGVLTWAYVERRRGHLCVDPVADEAITQAVENGVEVILCLDKGNWLHAPCSKQKDRTRELMETYYDRPPEPTRPLSYLQGYLSYVRYMVRHFKNRVRYYEIMNEWPTTPGAAKEYSDLAKAVIPVIRREYPEAKIIAASTPGFRRSFIEAYLKEGLGPMIDVIAWHPFYQTDPEAQSFRDYPHQVQEFKKVCESYGFAGEYMATEYTWSAPSPPAASCIFQPSDDALSEPISELTKAKYASRVTVKHVGLDIVSLWNETFQTQLTHWSIGLLRNTFSADPLPPTQPEPIYYIQRTLSTVLEDVQPIELRVEIGNCTAEPEVWTFERGSGTYLVAIWMPGRAEDCVNDTEVDIFLPDIRVGHAIGIDILNGRKQGLTIEHDEHRTVLRRMLLKDFPIFIVLSRINE